MCTVLFIDPYERTATLRELSRVVLGKDKIPTLQELVAVPQAQRFLATYATTLKVDPTHVELFARLTGKHLPPRTDDAAEIVAGLLVLRTDVLRGVLFVPRGLGAREQEPRRSCRSFSLSFGLQPGSRFDGCGVLALYARGQPRLVENNVLLQRCAEQVQWEAGETTKRFVSALDVTGAALIGNVVRVPIATVVMCSFCGEQKFGKFMSCSICQLANYCDSRCQLEDWEAHKKKCC